jgi:hypothetical protein
MKRLLSLALLLAAGAANGTTATGQCAVNFAVLPDENPWVDADFTVRNGGTTRIASGLVLANTTGIFAWTGTPTYDGGAITCSMEINVTAADDESLCGALDENGDGFLLEVSPTAVFVLVLDNYAVIDSNGTAAITFATDDLFTFTVTKGSPNSYSATRNGVAISLSATTYSLALGTLEAAWSITFGNTGVGAIKSLAIVDGLTGNCGGGGSSVPVIYQILRQQKK